MSKEINVTYDTVFDMLRNEKTRDELQQLSPTFLKDLVDYLNDKKTAVEKQDKSSPFADTEVKKTVQLLDNIYRMVRELYDRRERKIVLMAINKVRIPSGIVDTSALLEEEKVLFDSLVTVLSGTRQNILIRVLEGNEPITTPMQILRQKEVKEELEATGKELLNPRNSGESKEGIESEYAQPGHAANKDKLVRFLNAVPRFVGPELELYGPYDEDDIANLPAEIASAIIAKGRAEEIQEQEK